MDEGCRPAHPGHRALTPVREPWLAEEIADIAILRTLPRPASRG